MKSYFAVTGLLHACNVAIILYNTRYNLHVHVYTCTLYISNTLTEKIHSSLFEIGWFLSPTTFSRTHMATNTPRFERIVNAVLLSVSVCGGVWVGVGVWVVGMCA